MNILHLSFGCVSFSAYVQSDDEGEDGVAPVMYYVDRHVSAENAAAHADDPVTCDMVSREDFTTLLMLAKEGAK